MTFLLVWVSAWFVVALASEDIQQQGSIYKGLYDFVLQSSSPLLIPKTTLPISVGVQCGIVAIHDVDREKNEIDVTRWGSVTWHSDLTWDPSLYNGLRNISIPYHSIWLPDLHLYNANSAFEFIREPSAVLFSSGIQAIFAHTRSKIHCGDDLDEDKCAFRIASWGSSTDIIRINDHSENPFNMNKILANEELKSSKYKALSYNYTKKTIHVGDLPDKVDVMEFTFTFEEKKTTPRYQGPFKAIFQWS